MVIKTASPGVIINEVDLTRGTSDAITTNVGGMVGPFQKGPVDELVLIETENELQKVFGDPTTENCEYWYTISNFLEYGGVCYVIRCDDESGGSQLMKNACDTGTAPYVKNKTDFEENYYLSAGTCHFLSQTPGKWGNAIGVAVIDAGADDLVTIIHNSAQDGSGQGAGSKPFNDGIDPGTEFGNVFAVKAPAFVPPSAFAAVVTASLTNITLADLQDVAGVTLTAGQRVLVDGQSDSSTNGIYLAVDGGPWTRAEDADASADFQFAKSVTVSGGSNSGVYYYERPDNPVIGTDPIDFSTTNPAPNALTVGTYVQLGNPKDGVTPLPRGLVTQISADGGTFYIAASSTTGFVDADWAAQTSDTDTVTATSFLASIGGEELTGIITAAEPSGASKLYDYITSAAPYTAELIDVPQELTVAQGHELFNWTQTPRNGQEDTTTAGQTFAYSSDLGVWAATFNYHVGGYIWDNVYFHEVKSNDDWYNQQIAFEGVPWYRFASRPRTTRDAVARGAKNDGLNILIYDATGDLTGSKGNTLEQYNGVSKLKNALSPEGEANYYERVINERSEYIYANQVLNWDAQDDHLNNGASAVGTAIGDGVTADYIEAKNYQLVGGVSQLEATIGERQLAYNKFTTENVSDLDYLLQGPGGATLNEATAIGNFLINVVEERRDCMCFLSPYRSAVIGLDSETVSKNIERWADTLSSSSYAVFDSGYKFSFDRFNDVFRYLPLNGDTAGTVVFTAVTAEPYYSPAGIARGQIRNVAKLPYNPSKAQRDILYAARVNPVVTFPGEGTVLFGDKTALGYSSAFDRINVRRLFLVVEKEIGIIARTNLFEFNDTVTQTLFKNNVNPFLRDIQSKRGMFDFLVVCDQTNNPPAVIDRNEFIADIYIQPARSINFVSLNFVATKTGVSFEESVASFRGTTGTTGA